MSAKPGHQPVKGEARPASPFTTSADRDRRTLLWFFPLAFYSSILIGAVVGFLGARNATCAAEVQPMATEASTTFFNEYSLVVVACQAAVTLALSLRGTLPGTARYWCTRL